MVQVHRPTWQHVCLLKNLSCSYSQVCTPVLLSKVSKELGSVNIKLRLPKCKHHRQAWTASLDSFLCVWTGMNPLWELHWHGSLQLVSASSAPLADVLPQLPSVTGLSQQGIPVPWPGLGPSHYPETSQDPAEPLIPRRYKQLQYFRLGRVCVPFSVPVLSLVFRVSLWGKQCLLF